MIEIEHIRVDFPGFCLQDINLSVEKGDFFILIGPTGAGKTILLEALMGLVPVKSGKIWINGINVTDLPPEERRIGIVYQDYALFPHLTVLENIKYGLRYNNVKRVEAEKRLDSLLDQLNLNSLKNRPPKNLSGGEKQRVALARALVVNPSVLLLDEPLSALDPNFREEIQMEMKRLHMNTGSTFLMVTHDFSEVLSLGRHAAVINEGRIEQVGRPSDIFQRPDSLFVAQFVGMRNLFPATINGDKAMLDGLELKLEAALKGDKAFIAIRSEDIMVMKEEIAGVGTNIFRGRILGVADRGPYCEISVRTGKIIFKASITKGHLFEMDLSEAEEIYIAIRPSAIHVF